MIRIRNVKPLTGFRVRLELTNGKIRIVDLSPFLRGPIFEPIRLDPKIFREVRVDEQLGTIVWNNGADIDPDVLLGMAIPATSSLELSREKVRRNRTGALTVREPKTSYRPRKRKKG